MVPSLPKIPTFVLTFTLSLLLYVFIDYAYITDQLECRPFLLNSGLADLLELERSNHKLLSRDNYVLLVASSFVIPVNILLLQMGSCWEVLVPLLFGGHAMILKVQLIDRVDPKVRHLQVSMIVGIVYFLVRFSIKYLSSFWRLKEWKKELALAEKNDDIDNNPSCKEKASKPKKQPKVLILYANVGSGHKSAANAVASALLNRDLAPDNIQTLDVLDPKICSKAFIFVMQNMFQKLTQSLAGQHTLGYLYDMGDGGNRKSKIQRTFEDACLLGLVREIAKFRPDTILCTHFLPAQLCGTLFHLSKAIGKKIHLGLVITDLDLQSMWVSRGIKTFYLPRDDASVVLEATQKLFDLEKSEHVVSGIPILPKFIQVGKTLSKDLAQKLFGLNPLDKRPVVVLMSGGKLIEDIYNQCLAAKTGLRFVVVMGRQADVRSKLGEFQIPSRHEVTFIGFCTQMAELLVASDLMIGKSGGLTVAENAALGLPLIILDPIPGQEQRNADILLELGAALKVNDLALLSKRIDLVFEVEGGELKNLEKMKKQIRLLGKPDSSYTVADHILKQYK